MGAVGCAGAGEPRAEPGSAVGWYRLEGIPRPVRGSLRYALPDVLADRRDVRRPGLPRLTYV